jgi:hypothetical protein
LLASWKMLLASEWWRRAEVLSAARLPQASVQSVGTSLNTTRGKALCAAGVQRLMEASAHAPRCGLKGRVVSTGNPTLASRHVQPTLESTCVRPMGSVRRRAVDSAHRMRLATHYSCQSSNRTATARHANINKLSSCVRVCVCVCGIGREAAILLAGLVLGHSTRRRSWNDGNSSRMSGQGAEARTGSHLQREGAEH